MEDKIKDWKDLTNQITENFIREYFEIEKHEEVYFDWVTIGVIFNFSDYWFNFADILECYKLNVSKEQLFSWYDSTLLQESNLSLSDFILVARKKIEKRTRIFAEVKRKDYLCRRNIYKSIK